MNILIDTPNGEIKDIYFPQSAISRLKRLGNVRLNETDACFTEEDMQRNIKNVDICITHWDTPRFTEKVLDAADRLKLIAHAAGTVADVASEAVFERGIRVLSANNIMAKYVAEGVLAYILSGLKKIPQYAEGMRHGGWDKDKTEIDTLFNKKVGLIGLGTVGRFLIGLLNPFDVEICVYDPYIKSEELRWYGNVSTGSIDDILGWADIISVHASLTPETYHMLNMEKLRKIRDGALFVNTARGAVIDEEALIEELGRGRFSAYLDVFEKEPLDEGSVLRKLKNVTAMPHIAGASAREQMTFGIIEEIERFVNSEALKYEITYEKYKTMTRERYLKLV